MVGRSVLAPVEPSSWAGGLSSRKGCYGKPRGGMGFATEQMPLRGDNPRIFLRVPPGRSARRAWVAVSLFRIVTVTAEESPQRGRPRHGRLICPGARRATQFGLASTRFEPQAEHRELPQTWRACKTPGRLDSRAKRKQMLPVVDLDRGSPTAPGFCRPSTMGASIFRICKCATFRSTECDSEGVPERKCSATVGRQYVPLQAEQP